MASPLSGNPSLDKLIPAVIKFAAGIFIDSLYFFRPVRDAWTSEDGKLKTAWMKLINAFRSRNPIGTAIIGLLFGPDVVMAYLGRGWLAILYVFVGFAAAAAQIWWAYQGAAFPLDGYLGMIGLRIVGGIHGYLAARSLNGERHFPWYSRWYSLLLVFGVGSAVLALMIRSLLFQPFAIPANSMAPTLQVGDYVFANKYIYGYGRYSLPFGLGPKTRWFTRAPERGDVVIFRAPNDLETDFVKRIVGISGDHIQLRSGVLFLNGQPVPRQQQGAVELNGRSVSLYSETLPSGRSYTVAEISDDSRGDNTAEFVVPTAHYFMLGDNRDNSLDSRFNIGFVPEDNIVGQASVIVFNKNQPDRRWIWLNP